MLFISFKGFKHISGQTETGLVIERFLPPNHLALWMSQQLFVARSAALCESVSVCFMTSM